VGLEPSTPPNERPTTDGGEAARAEGRAASPKRAAKTASRAATTPKPPKVAAKADDLEAIKKAVDDAAAVGGGLWLSYLFVLFYLAVAAGAVTHADLFLEKPVKLPFLTDIELPLLAFFFLAPIVFLIVHGAAHRALVRLMARAFRGEKTYSRDMPRASSLGGSKALWSRFRPRPSGPHLRGRHPTFCRSC
jgi:hypothetical protein